MSLGWYDSIGRFEQVQMRRNWGIWWFGEQSGGAGPHAEQFGDTAGTPGHPPNLSFDHNKCTNPPNIPQFVLDTCTNMHIQKSETMDWLGWFLMAKRANPRCKPRFSSHKCKGTREKHQEREGNQDFTRGRHDSPCLERQREGLHWEISQCSPQEKKSSGGKPSKSPIFNLVEFGKIWVEEMD